MKRLYILYGRETKKIYLTAESRTSLNQLMLEKYPSFQGEKSNKPIYPEPMSFGRSKQKV